MFLYVITDNKNIKIGIAKDVKKRLACLQTGNAHKLKVYRLVNIPDNIDARKIEKTMHDILSPYRLNGEWFNIKCIKIIDEWSDDLICNMNNLDKMRETEMITYLYKIHKTEFANCILDKYALIYDNEGQLKYKYKKPRGRYYHELEDILKKLDDTSNDVIYTLSSDKAAEYMREIIKDRIEYISDKIKRHNSTISVLQNRMDELIKKQEDIDYLFI